MDKQLDTSSGDYTGRTTDNLQNAVYIRLLTPYSDRKSVV